MGYLSCRNDSSVATGHGGSSQKETGAGLRRFRYEELESTAGGFSPATLLGKGSHGCVFKAVLDNGRLPVAVKVPTAEDGSAEGVGGSYSRGSHDPGENEIEILSSIRGPRFVNLLGFAEGEKRLIVVEFMPNGSLHDQLHRRARPPRWPRRVRLALQTAQAVQALHAAAPPVIHRDIKSSNVLIDGDGNARLGDFGLALRGPAAAAARPPAGTLGYLDPGYLTPEALSPKSDVYSFGILLLEIISGRKAIDVEYSPSSLLDWAIPLIRNAQFDMFFDPRLGPPPDPRVGREMAVLAARCVASSADDRPPMAEVVQCLKTVSKKAPVPIWNDLSGRVRNRKVSSVHYSVDCFERSEQLKEHQSN